MTATNRQKGRWTRWKGDTWPHGRPTETCPTCLGGGLKPGARERINQHRPAALTVIHAEKCPTCDGRGRLIVRAVSS